VLWSWTASHQQYISKLLAFDAINAASLRSTV
jgi:hypothetical protein